MKQKLKFAERALRKIRDDNLYRHLRYGKVSKQYITFGRKRLLNLCSNDYLGISVSAKSVPQMQSSSRLVSGNDTSFERLEGVLASHKSQKGALVFPTGYMANIGAISALAKKGAVILSDELNHASIIEACRLSGAKTLIYKHNDVEDLQKKIRGAKEKTRFIVTEGIFSMDGDFADLKHITEIAERNGAVLVLDDAHGDFAVGKDGKGSAQFLGVEKKIDVYVSSLSKGLGSFGGYVASDDAIVNLCVNSARSFIYTSALPSFLVEMSLRRFKADRAPRQRRLEKNARVFTEGLRRIGYDIRSSTHIIPIIVGGEKRALEFGKYLMDNGVFAQPIRYPTVPKNSARLRVSMTAWLSEGNIGDALSVFEKAGKKFGVC